MPTRWCITTSTYSGKVDPGWGMGARKGRGRGTMCSCVEEDIVPPPPHPLRP